MKLLLQDYSVLADARNFFARAHQLDPAGDGWLTASGDVLAAYVCPLSDAVDEGMPVVLGMRAFPLREEAALDQVTPLGALTDRLMRRNNSEYALSTPPVDSPASWAGRKPPLGRWTPLGGIGSEDLQRIRHQGIEEVATALPSRAGAPVVAQARAAVWSRPIDQGYGLPAAAAFVAAALGFLEPGEGAFVFGHDGWLRMSTRQGHVLVRPADALSLSS